MSLISADRPLQPHPHYPGALSKKLWRHCGETIAKAIRNPRDRFCCTKCETGFYRTHCRVCERPIVGAKSSRRQLCGRRRCKLEFRRHQERFFRSRYPSSGVSPKREENPTKSKALLPENRAGTWTQIAGPVLGKIALHCAPLPLDPELLARHARDRKAAIAERNRRAPTPLIGPQDSPVNVVGGYRLPDAPEIDFSPIGPAPVKSKPAHAAADDPLAIPDSLGRVEPDSIS